MGGFESRDEEENDDEDDDEGADSTFDVEDSDDTFCLFDNFEDLVDLDVPFRLQFPELDLAELSCSSNVVFLLLLPLLELLFASGFDFCLLLTIL